MNIDQIESILGAEIECHVFETIVVPALNVCRKIEAEDTTEATDAIAPTACPQCGGSQSTWKCTCNPIWPGYAPSPKPTVDALEEGKKIMEKLWADPNGPFLKGQWEAPIAQPAVDARTSGAVAVCKGMNCGATDGISHSIECQAEHAAAVAGGKFVAHPASEPVARTLTDEQRKAISRAIALLWNSHRIESTDTIDVLRALLADRGSEES